MTKWQCVVFTINNWTDEHKQMLKDADFIRYCIYGEEIGEEEHTPHLQGYFQTKQRVTFSFLQKKLPGVHLIRSLNKNAAYAIAYTKKGEQSKAEWEELKEEGPNYGKNAKVTEWGEPLPGQGRRKDLTGIKKAILEDKIPLNIVVKEQVENFQQLRYAEGLVKYLSPSLDWNPKEVYWYWGKTGLGKTRKALEIARTRYTDDEIWLSPDTGEFLQGYWGQPCAIFDELRAGDYKYHRMLMLLDGIERRMNQKCTDTIFKARLVFITCPTNPEETYRGQMEYWDHIDQLKRRITEVVEFKEEPEPAIVIEEDVLEQEPHKRQRDEEVEDNNNVKKAKK